MKDLLRSRAKAVNFVLFQAGWFACVGGASLGLFWLGPAFVLAAMGFQGVFLQRITRSEVLFVCAASVLGTGIDTGMIAFRVYDPVRASLPWPLSGSWRSGSCSLALFA